MPNGGRAHMPLFKLTDPKAGYAEISEAIVRAPSAMRAREHLASSDETSARNKKKFLDPLLTTCNVIPASGSLTVLCVNVPRPEHKVHSSLLPKGPLT